MKLRRCLSVSACALALIPSALWAAPGAVPNVAAAPSVVVAPNPGVGGQGVGRPVVNQGQVLQGGVAGVASQPANGGAAGLRPVAAATLVDQSGVEEAPAPGSTAPVVAGGPHDDVVPADVAPAPEPKRGWLRQPRTTDVDQAEPKSSSDWSLSVLALVLLGGLAGGAVVMKLRRGAPAPWLPPAAVRVITTTRLTPKANLITAEVHGRVLLLGVTDSNVTELGWLDGNASAEGSLQTGERDSGEERNELPPNVNTRAGFGQVLGSVFRAGERKAKESEFRGNPNVAALIAAHDTRDVVSTNYSRATAGGERRTPTARVEHPSAPVETQVAGLARRRR